LGVNACAGTMMVTVYCAVAEPAESRRPVAVGHVTLTLTSTETPQAEHIKLVVTVLFKAVFRPAVKSVFT
jgi:hypothetical protein